LLENSKTLLGTSLVSIPYLEKKKKKQRFIDKD